MIRSGQWLMGLILHNAVVFWACMLANLMGVVIGGWWWYGPMLVKAPFWALPFIPDCPLAALLATVAYFGLRAERRWGGFYALAMFSCIKYGLWTQAFWLRYWLGGNPIDPVGLLMFVTHIGLFCEGLLLLPFIGPLGLPARVGVTLWHALAIFVDYGLSGFASLNYGFPFYPPMLHEMVGFMFWTATILTTLLGGVLLVLPRRGIAPVVTPGRAVRV